MITQSGPSAPVAPARVSPLAALSAKIIRRLKQGPYDRRVLIGLRRDTAVPFAAPQAKIPISLRPFRPDDMPNLFSETTAATERERVDIAWRLQMSEQGALHSRCFVAVDEITGRPCHIQWLTTGYSDVIRTAAALPVLQRDEVLLENAYTADTYRGMGIMSAVTAQIAERGAEQGARYVVAFIDQHNTASLRGGQRAGLLPWQIETQSQYGFGLVRRARFEPTPVGFVLPYEVPIGVNGQLAQRATPR